MSTNENNAENEKQYTLSEIKEKFFPNRDLKALSSREGNTLPREAFENILKKIIEPLTDQAQGEKQ